MLSKYEDVAQDFLTASPLGTVVYPNDLLTFAEQRGDGDPLKVDLALPDTSKQLSALRRHINEGGASRNVAQVRRFCLSVEDARRKTYVVVSLAAHAQAQAEAAFSRSVMGAITSFKASERALKDIKLDELDEEARRAVESHLHELNETAAPVKRVIVDQLKGIGVRRLVAMGHTPEQAISLIEVLPTLHREMKLLKAAA